MDVAIFASRFHPFFGGVEQAALELAREQQRRGDKPLVVTMRWPKTLSARETHDAIPIRRYVFRTPEWGWRQLGGALLLSRATVRDIAAEIAAHGCDLVHIQCVSSNAWYALRVADSLGLPLVATLQGELGGDETDIYRRSRVLPRLLSGLMERADAITACSTHALVEAESFTG